MNEDAGLNASIRVYANATLRSSGVLAVSQNSMLEVLGSVCNTEDLLVYGTVTLYNTGSTCGNPVGSFNFSRVLLYGVVNTSATTLTLNYASQCLFPGSQISDINGEGNTVDPGKYTFNILIILI